MPDRSFFKIPYPTQELVSKSHHLVWKLDESTFLKIARENDLICFSEILNEIEISLALGRKIKLVKFTDGRIGFTSPKLGEEISETFDKGLIEDLWKEMQVYWSTDTSSILNVSNFSWRDTVLGKINSRLGFYSLEFSEWCKKRVSKLDKYIEGDSLVHSDPHLKNWVKDSTGKYFLLDWESGFVSSPQVDQASLFNSAFIEGNSEMKDLILSKSKIDSKFANAWFLKSTSSVSWLAWQAFLNNGNVQETISERIELISSFDKEMLKLL